MMKLRKPKYMNDDLTMALGTFTLDNDHKVVKIRVDYLEKALKTLKTFHGKGWEIVHLAIGNDIPICMGVSENKNFTGIIISPWVKND